jgi:dihydrofolate synthase/folylpolyglutamate synthase
VAISRQAAQALGRPLVDDAILRGLAEVRWPGRLERIADVLLDCAHNVEGATALVAALPQAPRRVLVTSIVRDKNAAGMLSVLAPQFDCVVITRSQSDRAADPQLLATLVSATRGGSPGRVRRGSCGRASLGTQQAVESAGGLVVVAGSIFLVGELRAHLLGHGERAAEASDPLP